MKFSKALIISTLIAVVTSASAQKEANPDGQENGMRYLLEGDIHITGFGGMIVDFTSIEGDLAVAAGGGGAALVNQKFFIGGYGQGIATKHERQNLEINDERIENAVFQFGHGGLWLGYIIQPAKVLHMNINTKVGAGELALRESLDEYEMMDSYHSDVVTVINPSIGVNLNILKWFRISANAGYRFVGAVGDKTYDNNNNLIFDSKDYNAPTFSLSFLFGGFY